MHISHSIFLVTSGLHLHFTKEKTSPERFSNLLNIAQFLVNGSTENRGDACLIRTAVLCEIRGSSSPLTLVSVMLAEGG